MSQPFVHLHCHSHYSLLDGAAPIEGLIERAKSLGMNALAITDHGNLHGAIEFYKEAKQAGINPILGYEAYIAPGSRKSKDAGSMKEASYHLTLLAQNRTGFKNLIRMASSAYLDGFYFKPRIDKELLAAHSEGIICLSGCVSGELSRSILRGSGREVDLKEAEEITGWFHKTFGDRYFIEVQNNGIEIQRLALEGSVDVAKRMGLPLVATCDAHYIHQEDAEAQDILLCINTGKFRTDTNRMKMENDQFYLRSPHEMYSSMPGLEDAVRRSQEIADSVSIDLDLGKRHFPVFRIEEAVTPEDLLRRLCLDGLKHRYAGDEEHCPGGELAPVVMERLERELSVINQLGFPNYFLIVWDFVRFAREKEIPTTARGSGVGSLVCYALYLSHVCPLKYDLLFERFLDISRREAPDIDIDFCQERRALVIQYVKDKYGEANVAQIGTFGTLAARAAIRDVGRAMSMPIPRVDAIIALVPKILGITISEAIDQSEDLRKVSENEPEVKELLSLAMKIEGLARNVGTHAAAVVIADQPLTEYVPLCRVAGKDDIITQWAMGEVEAAGLLKMDFLGLRNLTILSKAVDLIAKTTGEAIDPHKFPLDDKPTFALLCRGETKGVFQLESGGIRDLLQKMKPDHFRDIIATNALYRPGPLEGGMVDDYVAVKHGRKEAAYPHPVMRDVLEETHGVMVYQEQVMRILNRLGGIELSSAYSCIKAISKKKLADIAKYQQQFIDGSHAQGFSRKEAAELFGMIEKFAGYGFNKSHSTAYALIAYQTAYLKAHWPLEFMAALLTGDIPGRNFKSKDALVEHIEDCRRIGIEVLGPNINLSEVEFTVDKNTPEGGRIVFALSAVKGCGGGAGSAIVEERLRGGPYTSLFDFCERIDPRAVNRAAIETLIKAGAFDSFGAKRSQLMAVVERALQSGASALSDRRAGQRSMFDELGEEDANDAAAKALPDIAEWDERVKLSGEREVLGYYLSSHPLAEHMETLQTYCTHTAATMAEAVTRSEIIVGGMVSSIKHSNVKAPRAGSTLTRYAMFDLEDSDGIIRCIIWPEQFAMYQELVVGESIVAIKATVDRRPGGDEVNLLVNEMMPIGELAKRQTRGVRIRVDETKHGVKKLEELHEVLRLYNGGTCAVELLLCLADGTKVRCECDKLKLTMDPEIRRRVDELLGPGNFKAIAAPPPAAKPERQYGQKRQFAKA
ncbi:MAG: DNA polymerase III subunit alpha [Planctomycetes bacterium]|nr:DNA polymerase III subunit alpha [Planctomycetota bacterium]